jgi:trk system potassium uptake protein TrkA
VEHNNEITIPNGNTVISEGDLVYIMATPKKAAEFFRKIGLKTTQVRNVMIVGGGTISYYLATLLQDMRIEIKIIEKDKERCEFLAERLPGVTIINGDGTDRDLLLEEGLPNAEALVALTDLDEENIFLALSAKKSSSAKLIAKVDRLPFDDVIDSLDIDSVIYPKYVTADSILQYVRAMQNASGSNVETLYHIMENRAEALEFRVNEVSPVVGIPLSKLKLKPHLLVGCLNRNGKILIPRGHDMIEVGDTVIIVTTNEGLKDITDILAR